MEGLRMFSGEWCEMDGERGYKRNIHSLRNERKIESEWKRGQKF